MRYEAVNGNLDGVKAHLDVMKGQVLGGTGTNNLVRLGRQFDLHGFEQDAAELLTEFEKRTQNSRVPAAGRVYEYLLRGDESEALRWLERAAEDPQPYIGFAIVMGLSLNEDQDPILDKPEFVEVRNRLGFTDL